jgi:glycosyltransferase involved in cell wall biosynthesis
LTRLALNKADRIIAVSRSLASVTASIGVKNKITVIPDGIDTARFVPGRPAVPGYILFVGSFIPRKGVEFLLKAMPAVRKECPEIQLKLIGEGPLMDTYKELIANLKIAPSVQILGRKSQQEVSELMRGAQVFVLPSLNEGLGVVLLEALSSGIPCAASNVDGIVDVVTPDVGRLFSPGNPDEIAREILEILRDPEYKDRLRTAARIRAETVYEWSVVGEQIKTIYREMLSEERANAG